MEFLLTLIIGVVIFFWIAGLLGRFLLRRWINRATSAAGGRQEQPRPEGEVRIRRTQPEERVTRRDAGEYVEFEEIEITETEKGRGTEYDKSEK